MDEQGNEEGLLRRVFGMLDDKVRIYQIAEDREVMRDEFVYCQIMHSIVFGDRGFAETLGPTWHLIHDPRFRDIENLMVVDRKAIFGGDARLGKQYFNEDGTMSASVSDLEKYSEMLGEGRNFHNALAHPDESCQMRLWLERIYRGFTNLEPHAGFGCTCTGVPRNPSTFKDAPDEDVWALVKQECPNRAFNADGTPNDYGRLMHGLIRADLVGLVHDYAETPVIDSYVYLRDHGIVTATESVAFIDPHGQEAPRVLQEIDILEQALTYRSVMRVTALKLLKKIGFEEKLRDLAGEGFALTDLERDELLRLIYESDYPEESPEWSFRGRLHEWEKKTEGVLLDYVSRCAASPLEKRESDQLLGEMACAQETVEGLKTGRVRPINQYTEPTAEIPADQSESEVMQYSRMVEELQANEFKWELYQRLVQAEASGETAVIDILTPVFLTPDYKLDETGFYNILESISIGSKSLRAERLRSIRGVKEGVARPGTTEVEGEFHSNDNPGGMLRS